MGPYGQKMLFTLPIVHRHFSHSKVQAHTLLVMGPAVKNSAAIICSMDIVPGCSGGSPKCPKDLMQAVS